MQQRFHLPQPPAQVSRPPSRLKKPTASMRADTRANIALTRSSPIPPLQGLSPANLRTGAGSLQGGARSSPDHRLSHPFDFQARQPRPPRAQALLLAPGLTVGCRGEDQAKPFPGPPSHPLPHISPSDLRPQGGSDPSATSGVGLGAFLQSQRAKEVSPYDYRTETGAETRPGSWTA